jgi:hypothetical protein
MIFDLSPISGSINEKYDLVTAKELLRHSSVAVAAAHYVENRKRGTTGLGALLKASGEKLSPLGATNRETSACACSTIAQGKFETWTINE